MQKFPNSFIITGSIASGKSTFANLLRNAGFSVIDADVISHEQLEICKDEVVAEFGAEILTDAKIDRKKLGSIVFQDREKLKILEQILHPKIEDEIERQAETLEAKNKPFFIDIPLYFEGLSRHDNNTPVIVVYAPKNLLIKRLMGRNGLDFETAKSRVELQADIEQKRQMATFVIDNSRDLEYLQMQTAEFLDSIRS